MTAAMFVKHLCSLRPADAEAEAVMRALGMGELVEVTVKKRRNPQHNAKLFALLNLIVSNTDDRWPNVKALAEDLKMATGLFENRVSMAGTVYFVPKSLSFASMDQVEFSKWYDQALDVIVTRILPGVGKDELEREVMERIGPAQERKRA